MTREEAKRYIDGSLPVPRKITDIIIHCSATIEGKNYATSMSGTRAGGSAR